MPILRKLNPDATDKNFNFTRHASGCCPQDQICAYKIEFETGEPVEAVTFLNSKRESTVYTFDTPVIDSATLETELKTMYTTCESDNGFGAVADGGGLTVEEIVDDTVVTFITDVVISSFTVNGAEVVSSVDCTTAKVCDCQFVVTVDEDVSAIELAYNGSVATLAIGTYATGETALLQTDVETALTALGVDSTGVEVTENTNEGLFLISTGVVGDCSSVTWNTNALLNCGCEQSYLFEK